MSLGIPLGPPCGYVHACFPKLKPIPASMSAEFVALHYPETPRKERKRYERVRDVAR